MCDWNEFRKNTLMQYKKLEDKGFELEGHGTFFEMKIDLLDSELFIKEYEQGKLDKTLEPIEKVLKKVNESFDIFDDIQNKAKKYYLDLEQIN
ncbi:hypothetical protein [Acinetobacter sp. 16]|nr:hypothetical protein [Acinetobacter sp. 16]